MKPSARRVLELLRQGPATTHDLMQSDVGGVRFGARLRELRELGFAVTEERLPLPARGSRYTLVAAPETFSRAAPERGALSGPAGASAEPLASEHPTGVGDGRGSAVSLFDADAFATGDHRDIAA